MGDFVAVVTGNWWRAKEALRELPIVWSSSGSEDVSSESILEALRSGLDSEANIAVAKQEGDTEAAMADAPARDAQGRSRARAQRRLLGRRVVTARDAI